MVSRRPVLSSSSARVPAIPTCSRSKAVASSSLPTPSSTTHWWTTRLLELCPVQAARIFVGKRDKRHTLPQAEINSPAHRRSPGGPAGRPVEGRRSVHLRARRRGGRGARPGGRQVRGGAGRVGRHRRSRLRRHPAHAPRLHVGAGVPHRPRVRHEPLAGGLEPLRALLGLAGRSSWASTTWRGSFATLIEGGRDPQCPAAVIENGTLETQRTVVGPLAQIADLVAARGIRPPALIVIGQVVGLREKLNWFERPQA